MAELLTTYHPTEVHLQIEPDFENNTFKGRVKIDYKFSAETTEIKLRASKDLQWTTVNYATFFQWNNGEKLFQGVDSENYVHDAETEILTIPVEPSLTPQNTDNGFFIVLEWTGTIGVLGATEGFYAMEGLQDSIMYEANFEKGNAHKVFPCYDEGVSAKYWLTVITDKSKTVTASLNNAGHEDFEKDRVKHNFLTEEERTIEDIHFQISDKAIYETYVVKMY